MKKKIISGLIAMLMAIGGVPNISAFADTTSNQSNMEGSATTGVAATINGDSDLIKKTDDFLVLTNTEITTDAAVIPGATTEAAVTVNKVVNLTSGMQGDLCVGGTISIIEVQGFDANGNEVDLDEGKIKYEWIANDEVVGTDKSLEITEALRGKKIEYSVSYDD
ncbi:hypothetical protein CDLVIII_2453 [Clostridium sp. DL-VIII]|uniref:hypothetical protein n=1 Tax=Clostridium sp. DL-VIII TaxID=641107 RepID=UPI00023AFF16|nr:hypothetical protein [Clostridium sp. DL-VIII]EHI99097.1 hypothetical protein CDLVIII_2453 [Clostridium sp. DL-VIII]